jgi:hypothetical protein
MLEERYPALRFIVTMLKVIAWIILTVFTLAAALMVFTGFLSLDTTGVFGGVLAGVGVALYGLLTAVFVYAAAETIQVVIDIEKNTRPAAPAQKTSIYPTPLP